MIAGTAYYVICMMLTEYDRAATVALAPAGTGGSGDSSVKLTAGPVGRGTGKHGHGCRG